MTSAQLLRGHELPLGCTERHGRLVVRCNDCFAQGNVHIGILGLRRYLLSQDFRVSVAMRWRQTDSEVLVSPS
jgi:hypothetical protein